MLFHDSGYHNTCPLFQNNKVTFHLSKTLKTGLSKSGEKTNRSAKGKKAALNRYAAKRKKASVKKPSARKKNHRRR
jgi:hypothetical protein